MSIEFANEGLQPLPDDEIHQDLRRSSAHGLPRIALAPSRSPCTVLIEDRTFFRECVLASLQAAEPGHEFKAFESVQAWEVSAESRRTSLLILWMATTDGNPEGAFCRRLGQVQQLPDPPPVAVMADHDRPDRVASVMASGVRAFLPASMGVDMAVKVMDLVRAGGSFVPASTLTAVAAAAPASGMPRAADIAKLLSPRQLAVARAMRKGLPNKLIAYELEMCESTVKVHVRAIMRKLKARNRTEVAFLTRDLDSELQESLIG